MKNRPFGILFFAVNAGTLRAGIEDKQPTHTNRCVPIMIFSLNELDMRMKNAFTSVWRITCFAAILALTGCAGMPKLEQFSPKDIRHPAPQIVSTAAKGQPVYLHYDYDSLIVYHLQEPLDMNFMLGKVVVSQQEPLYRGIVGQKEVLCSRSRTFRDPLVGPQAISCFFDAGRTGKVDTVTVAPGAIWFEKSIGHSIPYEGEELARGKAQPIKRELIFTGYADGQLAFLYREYKDDLKKAVVNQPLFVPVESFPAKKEVKGLSIEFLSATDAQVSYKILAGFQP